MRKFDWRSLLLRVKNDAGNPTGAGDRRELADLINVIVGLIGSLLALVLLALLAARGYAFSATVGATFDVDAKLMMMAFVVASLGTVVLLVIVVFPRVGFGLLGALCSPLLVLGLGLAALSLRPGRVSAFDALYSPPSIVDSTRSHAVPVLFGVGQSELSSGEESRLKDVVAIASACGSIDFMAFGFASSTPFKSELVEATGTCDSDCRNLRLAQLRANSIVDALDALGIYAKPYVWAVPPEMHASRLVDTDAAGGFLENYERLNRRAELRWKVTGCE